MTKRVTRKVTMNADGVPLSGLLAEPSSRRPRGVLVALHGLGMRSGYFDGRGFPGQSLLDRGVEAGWTVLAIDRPGYGVSACWFTEGLTLAEQATALRSALDDFASRHAIGEGFFLVGHSFGGMLALTTAAEPGGSMLLGVDVSGCGRRRAVPAELVGPAGHRDWKLNWGKLSLYPPGTFRDTASLICSVPVRELDDARQWPSRFAEVAGRITVPVRLTFAEYERWWRHDASATVELAELFDGTAVRVEHQEGAGHNISLGWAASSHHSRVLEFARGCLPEGRRFSIVDAERTTSAAVGA